MTYVCEITGGHRLYLDQSGDQTSVLSVMSAAGQQQHLYPVWGKSGGGRSLL